MSIFEFIRHGEPVGGRRYRGSGTDSPLNENGWGQMWYAIGDDCHWESIVTSPLQRCSSFARALSEKHNIPYQIDDRLSEIGFGVWEGRTPDEIREENANALKNFYHDPVKNRPEGAELLSEFCQRIGNCWEDIYRQYQNSRVLVIAHAGVMRAVVGILLGIPQENIFRLRVPYADRVKIHCDGVRPPLVKFISRPPE